MKYSINLVRQQREEEQSREKWRLRLSLVTIVAGGMLMAAVIVTVFQVFGMRFVILSEQENLARIKAEYGKYKTTKMLVNKGDIELLDSLQNNRIFWTRKLVAMAKHLPEDYWITEFHFQPPVFRASGFGYISPQQEELITIDDYLNQLRVDSTYCDVLHKTFFNSTERTDEKNRSRVSFEFSSNR